MVERMTLNSRFDGLGISVMVVRPEVEPKAVIQLAHGVCGCKERFMNFMEYMAERGIASVAGDHRGHGESVKSIDDLGYMYDGGYMALVDDMRLITETVHTMFPSKPVYLLGHSMGSMAARVYVKYDDSSIDGLILTGSPSWEPMSYVGRVMAGLLCKLGLSHYRMTVFQNIASNRYNRAFPGEGFQAWTCSDPEVRKAYMDNPICNFRLTANGSYNVLSLMYETYKTGRWVVYNPNLPILFISGADDPLMRGESKLHATAQNICDRGYQNVSSAIYPAMRHEVMNEIGKEEVWEDLLKYMGF